MVMSRRDYRALAFALREAYPLPMKTGTEGDLASDFYAGRVRGWEDAVLAVTVACMIHNPHFMRTKFLMACGFIRRLDGQMYAPEGLIE